jgi:hypothetical protein
MVQGIPYVHVEHTYGIAATALGYDVTPVFILESKKGYVNKPILISSPAHLRREYGVNADLYFALGGAPAYFIRAAYGEPTHATHYIKDVPEEGEDAVEVIKLVAKRPGSEPIYIKFTATGEGYAQRLNLTVEETEGWSEYYIGVRASYAQQKPAIQRLVEKINRESDILEAYFKVTDGTNEKWAKTIEPGHTLVTGTGKYATITKTVMGTGTGNIPGDDGDGLKPEEEQKPFDIISDDIITDTEDPNVGFSPSEIAHAEALKAAEELEVACVVCLKALPYEKLEDDDQKVGTGDVYSVYIDHVDAMNTPESHAWRFTILGASDKMNKNEILERAHIINSEKIVFVGQGLIDVNGNEWPPYLATMAVAAKVSQTPYNVAIWGGRPRKALRGTFDFLSEPAELQGEPIRDEDDNIIGFSPATRQDVIDYNEGGVITFYKDKDGIKIREGVTTVQQKFLEFFGISREDELAVVRIINHAKYVTYDACYSMLGEGITSTFQMDLETQVAEALNTMVMEGGLIDFSVSSRIQPVLGGAAKVYVDISITPVHAARQIDARIVVM